MRKPRINVTLQWGHDDVVVERRSILIEFMRLLLSFNGATTMASWKGRRRTPIKICCPCFNGATTMVSWKGTHQLLSVSRLRRLQWGHDDGVVERTVEVGHHVRRRAASMGPRRWSRGKAACSYAPGERLRHASMGPRRWSRGKGQPRSRVHVVSARLQWGHDDGVVEGEFQKRHPGATLGFNGATTMESWKGGFLLLACPKQVVLQWGHDDGVVERILSTACSVQPINASMGPRRWSRGKVFIGIHCARGLWASMGPRRWSRGRWLQGSRCHPQGARLQWGHDDGVVERGGRRFTGSPCQAGFNGATTMESWKGAERARVNLRAPKASMGPRRWSRGKARRGGGSRS